MVLLRNNKLNSVVFRIAIYNNLIDLGKIELVQKAIEDDELILENKCVTYLIN